LASNTVFKLITFLHLYLPFCNFPRNNRCIQWRLDGITSRNACQICDSVAELETFSVWHKYGHYVQILLRPTVCNVVMYFGVALVHTA